MHLYAVYLGGRLAEDRMGEDHEVVFVVAPDSTSAKAQSKTKWHGFGRPHVDAVQRVEMVDGYEIALAHVSEGDRTELDDYND